MSILVIRDPFGEVYLLSEAGRRPEWEHRLQPLQGHLAAWVLRRCEIDEHLLLRFLQELEPGGLRPVARHGSSTIDEVADRLDEGDGGRLTLWYVLQHRPMLDGFEVEEEVPLLTDLAEPVEEADTWFEVELVDEAGEPISGVELRFTVTGATETATTDGSGKARIDTKGGSFGSVSFVSPDAVRKEVEPRWEVLREPKAVADRVLSRLGIRALAGAISIESKVTHLVVVEPPLGKIFMELRDRSGQVLLRDQAYRIEGPQTLEGRTDDDGRLLHEGVPAGDYQLTVTVEIRTREDAEPIVDEYSSPVVVLDPGDATPQLRCLAAVPRVRLARLRGLLFDTNKCFLLPTALPAMRSARKIWRSLNPVELLVAGHTDTTGEPAINDPLSEERAKSVKAFLEDDVDAWLAQYDAAGSSRWGGREDRLMLTHVPGFAAREPGEDPVRWFQRTRGLSVDGKAGPKTRRALVTEYMELDGPPLADEEGFHLSITTLGCGERHPLADDAETLDEAPTDEADDQHDRRAELLFFDTDFGVLPPVAAPDGPEYLDWRARAEVVRDELVGGMGNEVEILELHDALFRLDSAVVLPEGERPDDDEHEALTSVGLFASLLRYNEEHPGRRILVAGHTDTSGGEAHNQALSEERARCAVALLRGDREAFVELAEARHKVGDYKQILSWCSAAFGDRDPGEGGFDCAPAKVDDVAATGVTPVRRFQAQYNDNREAIGAAGQPELAVDGDVGPMTWGALFDVMQFGIAEELGEDAAGVEALRGKLQFLRDGDEAIGFGEHHPIDQPHRDALRSQTNRRIEILLFDATAEVDLDLAKEHPDISELYLPGVYRRRPIPTMVSAKPWRARWDRGDEPAKHLRARAMTLEAPGLPEGTTMSFEVSATVDHHEPATVATLELGAEEGRCVQEFVGWAAAVVEPDPERVLRDPLPAVSFRFVVEGGGRRVESRALAYGDELDLSFVHAETEEPFVAAEWTVLTSWGYLEGVTGEDGRVHVVGLPPGGARATLAEADAVSKTDG